MDVKGACLNSDLNKETYMCQPEGFDDGSRCVLKLRHALYGLKQSGQAWYQRLQGTLLELEYVQGLADECTYIRKHTLTIEIITAYVDDCQELILGCFHGWKVSKQGSETE